MLLKKPIISFLVSLILLLFLWEAGRWFNIPGWIMFLGLISSFKIALISLKKAIAGIRQGKNNLLLNAISIIGSGFILGALIYLAALFL